MDQKMIKVSKQELDRLGMKADLDEELLIKLIKGLEDIKSGNTKDWEEVKSQD